MNLSLKDFRILNCKNVRNKTVILRTDLNSTIAEGRLIVGPKILEHAKTIKLLSKNKAKLIVITHQGRKGEQDFVDLRQHAAALEALLKKQIMFSSWNNLTERIKTMKYGDILLLDNSRFLDFETLELSPKEHSKNKVIKELANFADMFVLDSLSIAHRPHATVVGFAPLLKSYVGPHLKEELKALKALAPNNNNFVLGGLKPEDSLDIMEYCLEEDKAHRILLGGILGELALISQGYDLGKKLEFLKEHDFLKFVPKIKELTKRYDDRILMPVDLAIDVNGKRKDIPIESLPSDYYCYDIGKNTIDNYCNIIKKSKIVVFNGPLGRFENNAFSIGTKKILCCIADSKAFSLIGGGDTITCLERLNFNRKRFSYVSLAGKALLRFLAGKRLIGLNILRYY